MDFVWSASDCLRVSRPWTRSHYAIRCLYDKEVWLLVNLERGLELEQNDRAGGPEAEQGGTAVRVTWRDAVLGKSG